MPTYPGKSRGKAEALGKISSMFQNVGGTVSDMLKTRAAEKRQFAKEEKQKPIDELRKRLLTTQVEQAEFGTKEKLADVESDKEIEELLSSIGAGDEERELIKTSPMKSNELLNVLTSAKERPQETVQEYAEYLSPESIIGQQVRSKLSPGQLEALDAMLEGKTEAPPEEGVPATEETLQPGEKAIVKPTTSVFKFDVKEGEPQKITRARKILSKIEGKRPTEKQKALVKRSQAIIDKFEEIQGATALRKTQREEKKADVAEDRKFQLDLFNKKMGIEKKRAETKADKLSKQDLFNNSDKLRDDFDKLSKTFNLVNDSYGRIQASTVDPSAAGDLALIFNYMKMLDPGSVVRESEFANAAATGGLGERWIAVGKKLLAGERLSPNMRNDFVDRSNKLFNKASETQQLNINRFTHLAEKFGVGPDLVVVQIEKPDKGGATKKQPGEADTIPTISTDDEYDQLPSGATFRDPDGNLRRKP